MKTPWGYADSKKEIAPGVIEIGTPSHGGYRVHARVVAKWPEHLRNVKTWAGPGWYEEDCDWALVVLAMPELFTAEQIEAAKGTARWMAKHASDPVAWARIVELEKAAA